MKFLAKTNMPSLGICKGKIYPLTRAYPDGNETLFYHGEDARKHYATGLFLRDAGEIIMDSEDLVVKTTMDKAKAMTMAAHDGHALELELHVLGQIILTSFVLTVDDMLYLINGSLSPLCTYHFHEDECSKECPLAERKEPTCSDMWRDANFFLREGRESDALASLLKIYNTMSLKLLEESTIETSHAPV